MERERCRECGSEFFTLAGPRKCAWCGTPAGYCRDCSHFVPLFEDPDGRGFCTSYRRYRATGWREERPYPEWPACGHFQRDVAPLYWQAKRRKVEDFERELEEYEKVEYNRFLNEYENNPDCYRR